MIMYHVYYIYHLNYVIMSAIASQITGVSVVYSTDCSGTDQRKYQSLKMCPFDDVIMHIFATFSLVSTRYKTVCPDIGCTPALCGLCFPGNDNNHTLFVSVVWLSSYDKYFTYTYTHTRLNIYICTNLPSSRENNCCLSLMLSILNIFWNTFPGFKWH